MIDAGWADITDEAYWDDLAKAGDPRAYEAWNSATGEIEYHDPGMVKAQVAAILRQSEALSPAIPPAIPQVLPTGGVAMPLPVLAAAGVAAGARAVGPSITQAMIPLARQFAPKLLQQLLPKGTWGELASQGLQGLLGTDGETGLLGLAAGQTSVTGAPPGDLVKTWATPTTTFAITMLSTARGFRYQRWAWSSRRQLWTPVRQPRNIVIGAKELRIASSLGHRRHVGKRRLLQIIAQPTQMRRHWRGRKGK